MSSYDTLHANINTFHEILNSHVAEEDAENEQFSAGEGEYYADPMQLDEQPTFADSPRETDSQVSDGEGEVDAVLEMEVLASVQR